MADTNDTGELLDMHAVAALIDCSRDTLVRWCKLGKGPPRFKLGHKTVRFRRADVVAWIESRRVAP